MRREGRGKGGARTEDSGGRREEWWRGCTDPNGSEITKGREGA